MNQSTRCGASVAERLSRYALNNPAYALRFVRLVSLGLGQVLKSKLRNNARKYPPDSLPLMPGQCGLQGAPSHDGDQISEAQPESEPSEINAESSSSSRGSPFTYWLPLLCYFSSLGILLVSIAYHGGREQQSWGEPAYWAAMFILFLPTMLCTCSCTAPAQTRLSAVTLLGVSLYIVHALYSPLEFKFVDELLHLRSLVDIAETGRMFEPNGALPVGPYYPGLQILTAVGTQLGLEPYVSGVMIVFLARIVFVLSLYVLFEATTGSARIAGLGSVIYMTNAHFRSFSAMFTYQSVALPLATLLLAIITRHLAVSQQFTLPARALIVLIIIAITITHHLTSVVLLGFLLVWLVTGWAMRTNGSRWRVPLWIVLVSVGSLTLWVSLVAPITVNYLLTPISAAAFDLVSLVVRPGLSGFQTAPFSGPAIESAVSIVSTFIVIAILPACLYSVWRRFPTNTLAITLAGCSVAYIGSLLVRLATPHGSELMGRSWVFIYLPLAFVIAVGLDHLARLAPRGAGSIIGGALLVTMYAGGLVTGWPPFWARLPGPFLVSGFERSVEAENKAAALWMDRSLGRGHRIAADFGTSVLLGSYGRQTPVYGMQHLFLSSEYAEKERAQACQAGIKYIVIDARLSEQSPASGAYFLGEKPPIPYDTPINKAHLRKFDGALGVDRLFDSGEIQIYEIECEP